MYLAPYAIYQLKRRGIRGGLNALLKSPLVGLPISLLIAYYLIFFNERVFCLTLKVSGG